MTHHDDAAWIVDTLHVLERVSDEVKDISYEKYLRDLQLQHYLLYNLTVLVEASGQVSEPFREEHSTLPWRELEALRTAIREYWNTNHAAVWNFLTAVHPTLLPKLKALDAGRRD